MPALKGQPFCFAHHPEKQAARAAARKTGGANRRRTPTGSPPATEGPALIVPYELGVLERAADIGPALLRLARAVARGDLDARRGRLLVEALRAASLAFDDAPVAGGTRRGWDTLTADELAWMQKNPGKVPPGRTLEDLERAC